MYKKKDICYRTVMRSILRYGILIASAFLLIFGIVHGDLVAGILRKAINICYECIGIG